MNPIQAAFDRANARLVAYLVRVATAPGSGIPVWELTDSDILLTIVTVES